jgi:cytochrome c-type biogenesis protein CcmH/NrfG
MAVACLGRKRPLLGCVVCLVCLLTATASAEERLEDGLALFEQQRWAEAQQFFSGLLSRHPTDARAHFYLGRIAFGQQDYDTAVVRFETAVGLQQHNASFHLWLGRAYGRQAQHAFVWQQLWLARKVRQQFETAVALDPDSVAARWDLMEYYLKAPGFLGGSRDKAKTQAREIQRRDAAEGKKAWRLIAETAPQSE